jgi:hypothetical protein
MTEQTYNGWTNYETWLANLWITEGALGDPMGVEEQARYYAENGEDAAPSRMGEWLKEQTEEMLDEANLRTGGLAADLLGAALSRVDWRTIGKHYTDEAIENERQQTENANAAPIGHWSAGYTEPKGA